MKRKLSIFGTLLVCVLSIPLVARSQEGDRRGEAKLFIDANRSRLSDELRSPDQLRLLAKLATAAVEAGDIGDARNYADRLRRVVQEVSTSEKPDYFALSDYAAHISNTVLGLVAVDEGNVAKAKEYLLDSGRLRSETSATLGSFGPNMLLAKRLLEAGQREVVIQYLDLCSGFWKMEDGRLARWKEAVRRGEMPDFGPTLRNALSNWQAGTP